MGHGSAPRRWVFVLTTTLVGVALGDEDESPFELYPGHISGVVRTLDERVMTLAEAEERCLQLPECQGITMDRPPADADERLLIYLKDDASVHASNWVSYLHIGRARKHSEPQHAPEDASDVLFAGKPVPITDGFLAKRTHELVSAPELAPEALYTNGVRNLIGTTFEAFAKNPDKDIMVNLFAPWCGHCVRFKSQYAALARKLKHVKTLDFGQMDATQNQVRDLQVVAFPTILLYPGGRDRPFEYREPDRSVEAITRWLHTVCTHSTFADEAPSKAHDRKSNSGLLDDTEDL